MVARAMDRSPEVDMVLHTHRSPMIYDRVRSGEYLMGICAGSAEIGDDLKSQEIMREPMVIIPSGLSSLKRRGTTEVITIEERSPTWEAIARRARKLNISPVRRLESFFAVAQAGIAGLGHALVPYGVAKALRIPPASLVSFHSDFSRPITLVSRTSTLGRPFVQHVWEEMHRASKSVRF